MIDSSVLLTILGFLPSFLGELDSVKAAILC